MSNFRKKLLGDSYTFHREENDYNPIAPLFVYEINISSIKEDGELMQRLERFNDKAKSANYSMTNRLPEPGELPYFVISSRGSKADTNVVQSDILIISPQEESHNT